MTVATGPAPGQESLGIEKVMTAGSAIETLVADGAHLAVGGCLYSRTPMALLMEVLRQRRTGLTLSRSLACYESEMFLAVGAADTVETAWMGFGGRWGMASVMRERVEAGTATFNEYSHLGIAMRYRAGAMGVPFLPMRSMLGSDLVDRTDVTEMTCPITGERLIAVPAVQPDVALIHAHRGDAYGNVQIDGYLHMDFDIARAATHVIVSVEEVIDHAEIMRHPDRTVIPHFAVDAVVPATHGSYPHELYGVHDANMDHFDDYAERVRRHGTAGVVAYVDEMVHGMADHAAFLDTFTVSEVDRSHDIVKDLL